MKHILLIGGYGGFGARLARRLSNADTQILIGGRSKAKASHFAATLANARAVVLDRNQSLDDLLKRERPHLVIDAAGPFQGSSFTVAEACIRAGIAYLDLADAREFVRDFAHLDAAAKAANVALVTGASSVPALSGAVFRALMEGLNRADRIEMAISASNKASAGKSVTRAILSYAGRPLKLWRGTHWVNAAGWSALGRVRFDAPDGASLGGRWIALADVPDHDLLPERVAGRPSVTFRAGTELGFQMIGLWLASFLVRARLMRSLEPFAPIVLPFVQATRHWGGDRSAMHVIIAGARDGETVKRTWTLIAEQGDGPEIPTLAADLLTRKLLDGAIPSGACDAGQLLSLEEFQPLFDKLHLHHGIADTGLTLPVYARAMGERFTVLPDAVRDMHTLVADSRAEGEGVVDRARNPIAWLIGAMVRFPPTGHYPLHVDFSVKRDEEVWTRNFGKHRFASTLSRDGDGIAERFGPLRFYFALPSNSAGLEMALRRWTLFGITMPLALAPRTRAREWQDDQGRFRFDVDIGFPLIGRVVHYNGWLRRTGY